MRHTIQQSPVQGQAVIAKKKERQRMATKQKRKRLIGEYPVLSKDTSMDVTHIKLELGYRKGGINAFHGTTESRGYELLALPIAHRPPMVSSYPMQGHRALVQEAFRFSATQLDKVPVPPALAREVIQQTMRAMKVTQIGDCPYWSNE